MKDYFKLRVEESLRVVREMLNEDSLVVFPRMTEKQKTWLKRVMAVCDGESYAVPRRHLRYVRPPRRSR